MAAPIRRGVQSIAFAVLLLATSNAHVAASSPQDSAATSATQDVANNVIAPAAPIAAKDVDSRIAEIQTALDDLRESKSDDNAKISALESRLQLLRRIQDTLRQTKVLREQTDQAKMLRANLRERLASARENTGNSPLPGDILEADLREQLRSLSQSIENAEAQSEFVMSSIDFRLRRREELRNLESKNLQALATIDAESGVSTIDRKLQLERLQVEQELIEAERAMFKATDPNLSLSREVLQLEIQTLRARLEAAQDLMNSRVKSTARRIAADAKKAAEATSHPTVRRQADQNRVLAQRLEQIHADQAPTLRRLSKVRLELEDVRRQRLLDESRVAREFSPDAISQMRARFSEFPDVAQIEADIASEQLLIQAARDQLDFVETLTWLSDASADAAQAIASDETAGPVDKDASKQALASLFVVRQQQLVEPLRVALNERIDILSQLVALQQSVITEVLRYKRQVLDRTIWVRDPSATTADNFIVAGQQFRELFASDAWGAAASVLTTRAGNRPGLVAIGVAPALIWLACLPGIRRRTRVSGSRVSNHATDSLGETAIITAFAFATGVVWAMPAVVVTILLSDSYDSTPLIASLHRSTSRLWEYLFVAGTIWAILTREGLAERHFQLPKIVVHKARIALLIGLAMIPFGFFSSLCDPGELDLIPIGRILFTPVPILFAAMTWLLFHPVNGMLGRAEDPLTPSTRTWQWGLVGTLAGLLLLVALAANLGWYRLVINFHRSLVQSTLLIWTVILAREFLLRFLRARHRGATWRLRSQEDLGEDVSQEVEELEQLETRTLKAIRFSVIAGVVVGLYVIWKSVFPAFAGLDQVVIWSGGDDLMPSADLASTDSSLVITLGDILRCLVSAIVAWYTARNLPSLIELVIIDRFKLERGITYAITQLLQWAIMIGGLVYSATFLEISWSSVQWLAAGLTVGLGFGLQEIFANFISGLIILFERPIRLGDVVTVGGTNGRVSRIRMRSTTITDWDRKELVVPNKKFVTEEIVNWSIGEACIRVVLPVGVSYAEDPALIVEMLKRLGGDDPDVLKEPPPSVMFKSFGDSSLDFELRLYLSSTENMSDIRTRVNIAIKKQFDDAGITIPFPQRDMRVEMVRPDAPDDGPSMPLSPNITEDPTTNEERDA